MGAFYTLDGQHVPEPTIRQKHQEFIANGGISENFAIRTNPKEQVEKIIAMRAFSVGGTTIFLSRESNPNRSFITIPDLSESDIKELKIKTIADMKNALLDVARTQEILTGNKSPDQLWEVDSNLGFHTIESR